MKLRLGLIFIVISVLVVFGIFYFKNYYSYDTVRNKNAPKAEVDVLAAMKSSRYQMVDYLDKDSFVLSDGELVQNSIKSGKKVILHFWASWCSPCIMEIPELVEFAKNPENQKKFDIVVLSLDYTIEDLQKFIKSFPELNSKLFIQQWDKFSYVSKVFNVDKLPSTVVIGPDLKVQKTDGVVDWKRVQF